MARNPKAEILPLGAKVRTVVAAASRIRLDVRDALKKALSLQEDWQQLCSEMYDANGELKHAMMFLGDAMARVRLYVAEVPQSRDDAPQPSGDIAAWEPLDRIASDDGGHAEIMRPLGVQLSVAGESWLVGISERIDPKTQEVTPERWWVASVQEVERKGDKARVRDPEDGSWIELRAPDQDQGIEGDFIGRIWRPHAFRQAKADSSVRGVLNPLEELNIIGRYLRATARSRITSNSLVFIPKSMTLANPLRDVPDEPGLDPLISGLIDAWNIPISDEGSAGATTPVFLVGDPGPNGEGPGWDKLDITRPLDALILQWNEAAQRRVAQGINLPVEFVFGLGEANHWGAGQIEKSAFEQYIEPLVILAVNGLTKTYYRPALEALGLDPLRYMVWYDASSLVSDKERMAGADEAHDRFAISDEAYRREKRYDEADKPTEDEVARRLVIRRGGMTSDLVETLLRTQLLPNLQVQHLLPGGAIVTTPDGTEVRGPIEGETGGGSSESEAPAEEPVEAVAASAVLPLGDRLADIDADLAARLDALISATLHRALSAAGAKIRSKAQKDRSVTAACANLSPTDIPKTLGRSIVASLGLDEAELVRDVIEDMQGSFVRLVSGAQSTAWRESGVSPPAEADADLDDAWSYTREALVSHATGLLYDPNPDPEPEGEVPSDPAVPFEVIREAMAIAGGSGDLGADDVITAALRDKARKLGVAVGYRIMKALGSGGVVVEGWKWRYGAAPRSRPFKPHQDLNGKKWIYDDDDVLVSSGFPGPHYAPGDHKGCQCRAVPAIVKRSTGGGSDAP